jgi:hypothetical protein
MLAIIVLRSPLDPSKHPQLVVYIKFHLSTISPWIIQNLGSTV